LVLAEAIHEAYQKGKLGKNAAGRFFPGFSGFVSLVGVSL